jgi:hypothetical protein
MRRRTVSEELKEFLVVKEKIPVRPNLFSELLGFCVYFIVPVALFCTRLPTWYSRVRYQSKVFQRLRKRFTALLQDS